MFSSCYYLRYDFLERDLKILQFIISYISKPFIIWAIFFNVILRFTYIPEVFSFVEWILTSQIYLVIFSTSFVFSYLQQMLPILKSNKEIKKKQSQNKWTIPRIMTNRLVMNAILWLSAVLFFSGLTMSFGILYPESISDYDKYSQLRTTLQIIAFGLFATTFYYSLEFERILKKYKIEFDKKSNSEIIVSIISLVCFITLSYVAIINSRLI